MNAPVYGCPECETYAIHDVDATPSRDVDVANSLPDVVFECVSCGVTFERFHALELDDRDD